jgi:hypothetical protein
MITSSIRVVMPLAATVCVLQWAHLQVSKPNNIRVIVGNKGWRVLCGDGFSRKLVDETALDVVSSVLGFLMFGCYFKAAWSLRGEIQSRLLATTAFSTPTFVLHAAYTVNTSNITLNFQS